MLRPKNAIKQVKVISIEREAPERYQGRHAIHSPLHGLVYVGPMDPLAVQDAIETGVPDPRRFLAGYSESRVLWTDYQGDSTREVVTDVPEAGEVRTTEQINEVATWREW